MIDGERGVVLEYRKAEKAELRKRILKERDLLPFERRQEFDQWIFERLTRYDEEKPCGAYLCYVNFRSEVSTKEWIRWCLQKGKAVFVPKVLEAGEMEFYRIFQLEDLRAGCLGILEPEALPENSFHCWMEKRQDFLLKEAAGGDCLIRMIMPGAVFDEAGNRIGYGGGYYDRWLAKWEGRLERGAGGRLEKIALAYEIQVANEIPTEDCDRKANLVMTEERVLFF